MAVIKQNSVPRHKEPQWWTIILWIYLYVKISFFFWRRVIGIYGCLIWSKTHMEPVFNPCGEFCWSPEGPVSQIHSPHLHVGAPGIFSDLLRSVLMLNRESGAWKATGSYRTNSIPGKTATLVPGLLWKSCLWAELRPWFLSLQWRTCPWAEFSDHDNDD